ncbi:DnaT-like ssDNA-binding domain-containing protein [Sphingobium sp. H39-3-25]|nr:DnaT-like ssDNA-binding domain-containing protein [Sphingobium arseniciresistens]
MGPHARKGTRLDEDWQPDPVIGPAAEMIALWPPGSIERELAKFRNYWIAKPGKDATKANWQRTWVNWLMTADERIGRNGTGNRDTVIPGQFGRRHSRAEEMDQAFHDLGFGR